MAATVLGWIGLFGLGCWTGHWYTEAGHRIDQMVGQALGPPEPSRPGWLFDDESWPA
jgi:hypothetical protein